MSPVPACDVFPSTIMGAGDPARREETMPGVLAAPLTRRCRTVLVLALAALSSLLGAVEPVPPVATSASYEMTLDETALGGGTSSSGSTQLSGGPVVMLQTRSLGTSVAVLGGLIGATAGAGNRAPTLVPLSLTTTVDTPVSATVLGLDADGDPLLYGQGGPMPGTMQAFAPATGAFIWLPPVGATGTWNLPVTVTDGWLTASGTISVTVVAPQIVVLPGGTLSTTEAGGQAAISVRLNAPPSAAITVAVTSNRPGEVQPSVSSLSFDAGSWNVAQTVVLTGQPDGVTDGNQNVQVQLGPVAAGSNFAGVSAAAVNVVNIDQDIPGLVIVESGGATAAAEGGAGDSFTVALAAVPSGAVTLSLATDISQVGLASTTISFTALNWNVPRTVTVSAIDDNLAQGNRSVAIVLTTAGGGYGAMPGRVVQVAVTDNDSAIIIANPGSVTVSESGGSGGTGSSAQVSVSLSSQPSANVSVAVTSSSTSIATVSPTPLLFTTGNWSTPQTVTVTGVPDLVANGNRAFTVTLSASSSDGAYHGRSQTVNGLTLDTDGKNLVIVAAGNLQVAEGSPASASYTVRLSQPPTADVTVTLGNPDGYLAGMPPSLVFTPANYNVPRTVTVTAANDAIAQGAHLGLVNHTWTSADAGYISAIALTVTVGVTDNDSAGIAVAPVSGLSTTETGGTDQFTVVLTSQPASDVVVPLTSADGAQATVTPSDLTFTAANWSTPRTVTVHGADGNNQDDGDVAFSILVGPASSADGTYSGMAGATVTGTNHRVDNPPTLTQPVAATVGGVATPLTFSAGVWRLDVAEDCGAISLNLTGIGDGQAGENQTVTVAAAGDNGALTGTLSVAYLNPQSSGTLSFTPALHVNGTALITITVADGGANPPASRSFRLNVAAVDTPPVVDRITDATVAYHGVVPLTGLQANALAGGQLATSDIETPASALSITLTLAPNLGQLQVWKPGLGVWQNLALNDSLTQEEVDLGRLRYVHTDSTAALNDAFNIAVSDGSASAVGQMNIHIDPNLPSVDLLPAGSITFAEHDAQALVGDQSTCFNPVAALTGGTLAVSVSGGDAADTLDLVPGGSITLASTTVSYNATPIGTLAGGSSGAPLVLSFNSSADATSAQAALRQVVFRNASHNPSAAVRTVRAVLTNSLGFSSAPAERFLILTPVNDPPVTAALDLVAVAGLPLSATPVISDPDGPALTVTRQSDPTKGTVTAFNPLTGAFTYLPGSGQSGPDSFVLLIEDHGTPALTTTCTVSIAISGPATPAKPWIDSRPPVEAQSGDLLTWTSHVDITDVPGANLVYTTLGAPAGLVLTPDPPNQSVGCSWAVPAGTSGYVAFSIIVTDTVSRTATAHLVTLYVHPQPGGGG